MRLFELRLGCRAAIAAVTCHAGAGEGGDDLRFHVDLAHDVVRHVDDVEIAFGIKAELMREPEGGLQGGTAIAAVARLPCTCDGADGAISCHAADALAGVFAEPDGAVRATHDAEGIVDLRCGRRPAITAAALGAVPGKGGDGPLGSSGRLNEKSEGEKEAHG